MPNKPKNYASVADMKSAFPRFFDKKNKKWFGDHKYRAFHNYLIVEGTMKHSDNSTSRRVSLFRFAPELGPDPLHCINIGDIRNIEALKEFIKTYEEEQWPEKAARIAADNKTSLPGQEG